MQKPNSNTSPLRGGASQIDITPKMGIQIAGDIGRYRPAELLNDPIYANALNHIVVRDDMVLRVYEEHRSQLELDLCGEA